MKRDENDPGQTPDDATASEMSEAEIDANLEATFPASDPPSWTLGSNHHVDVREEPENGDPKDD